MLSRALEFPWIVAYYLTSWMLVRLAFQVFSVAWRTWRSLPDYLAPDGFSDLAYIRKSLECFAILALGMGLWCASSALLLGLLSLSWWLPAVALWAAGSLAFNAVLDAMAQNRSAKAV